MVEHDKQSLLAVYRGHPLTENALLRRLAGRRGPLSEFDLAIDRENELTDQNHIGGFLVALILRERPRNNL